MLRIDPFNLQNISDDEISSAPALIRTDRSGATLLLMTDAALNRAFPFRHRFLKDPDIQAIMRTDKDRRKKVTVAVRRNKKQERLYAFVIDVNGKEA